MCSGLFDLRDTTKLCQVKRVLFDGKRLIIIFCQLLNFVWYFIIINICMFAPLFLY